MSGFLHWVADTSEIDGDPLTDTHSRDVAVRDHRARIKAVKWAKPNTINAALTALDHFYVHHLGVGFLLPALIISQPLRGERSTRTSSAGFCAGCSSTRQRDLSIALMLLYAGLHADELAQLDIRPTSTPGRSTALIRGGPKRGRGGLGRQAVAAVSSTAPTAGGGGVAVTAAHRATPSVGSLRLMGRTVTGAPGRVPSAICKCCRVASGHVR